jgi:hypothetical protein
MAIWQYNKLTMNSFLKKIILFLVDGLMLGQKCQVLLFQVQSTLSLLVLLVLKVTKRRKKEGKG